MQYRREIDGLRALAVLPVVLFHAGIELFSGGYLGVDVFFVISGYLITGILIKDYQAQQFSLVKFYDRRARRILPALSLVMICTLPAAWFWLMPDQFESYAWSLVAVVLFVSNILFWRETNYFADAVEEKPLLHTWSLAVEEQFYIVFPILLMLMWRLDQRHIRFWLAGILVASLIWAEHLSKTAESAAFYLLPARAWELMAGALVAQQEFRKGVATGGRSRIYAALGLLLIIVSIFGFSEGTRHPSIYTVVPVLGTVLLIRYGRDPGWAHKLLILKPVVGVGLISYSLYLWHQPLFAFARVRTLHEPSVLLMLVLAAVAVLLAWVSWAYIEAPFRNREEGHFTRRRIFGYSAFVGFCFACIGVAGVMGNGFT
ncbi:MAG: acyltransferase family protein, partial [Nevskiales bacterium]